TRNNPSEHGQRARLAARIGAVDTGAIGVGQVQGAGARILARMIAARSLRDHEGVAYEEGERDLPGRGTVRRRDLLQHAPRPGLWIKGLRRLPEGRIGHDSDAPLVAPGQHGMLDGAFLEVVQHLVAGREPRTVERGELLEIVDIEITHAPRTNLAAPAQLLE